MQSKLYLILKSFFIFLFLSILFAGCGIWNNFTTYFNLYYDTTDIFNQAETEIKTQNTDAFATTDLTIPPSTTQSLQKVIEKCSNILQFHPTSSFVDDALLILGKSFYYLTNYEKSVRELQDLITKQPNSSLVLEAKLWIGKDQMKMRMYDTALVTLKDVINEAQANGKNNFVVDAYIEQIKYRIIEKEYSEAISLINQLLSVSKNNVINAQAAYEAGELFKIQNNYTNAIAFYKKVNNYSPTYLLEQNYLLELGRTYREDSLFQNSLDIFESMRSQNKYSDIFDVIDVEKGKTLYRMGKYEEALNQLVLVDTAYSRSQSAGIAEFEIAKIYQNHYKNLDSAYSYYNKALRSTIPQDLINSARNLSDMLKQYQDYNSSLANIKTQINYLEHPEVFIKDSIAYREKYLEAEQVAEDSLRLFEEKTNMNFRKNVEERDSLLKFIQTVQDTAVKDSLQKILTEKENIIKGIPLKLNITLKIPEPKRPLKPLDTLKTELVKDEYYIGNLLFTEFNMPDSAYSLYMDILNNYPDSKYQANVLYAVGSYYLVNNDSAKADSLFNIIYNKYRNESIVNAAADKLNKPFINFNYDPAEPLYSDAEKLMDDKKYDTSLTRFYYIYKTHHQSPYAAKALYASGWILENKLNLLDSAAVVYDTLNKEYPNSVYAKSIVAKLIAYRDEQNLRKQQHLDSLKNITGVATNKLNDTTKSKNITGKNSNLNNENTSNSSAEALSTKVPIQATVTNPDTLIRIRRKIEK